MAMHRQCSCHDWPFDGEGGELGENSIGTGQARQHEPLGVDPQHRRCSTNPVGGGKSGVISHIKHMDRFVRTGGSDLLDDPRAYGAVLGGEHQP